MELSSQCWHIKSQCDEMANYYSDQTLPVLGRVMDDKSMPTPLRDASREMSHHLGNGLTFATSLQHTLSTDPLKFSEEKIVQRFYEGASECFERIQEPLQVFRSAYSQHEHELSDDKRAMVISAIEQCGKIDKMLTRALRGTPGKDSKESPER